MGLDDNKGNESSKSKLKELSNYLRYAFLEENSISPMIISSLLTKDEDDNYCRY